MNSLLDRIRTALRGLGKPREEPQPPRQADEEEEFRPHLLVCLRAVEMADPEMWAASLLRPCRNHAIRNRFRMAAFCATIAHESNGGRDLVESFNYSTDALLERYVPDRMTRAEAANLGRIGPAAKPARAANERAIANIIYGGEFGRRRLGNVNVGDGWTFRGRGLIQLTGRSNYEMAAKALYIPTDKNPDFAADPRGAALISAWWWASRGCNEAADRGDIAVWRKIVNGGTNGLVDVSRRYHLALDALQSKS